MSSATLTRELNAKFPDKNKNMTVTPINPFERLNAARQGEDAASIPFLLPANAEVNNQKVRERRENAFNLSDEKDRRRYREALIASTKTDRGREEMAAYRSFVITNDIMASPFALAAFQEIDLSPDELPMIERPMSKNLQKFGVRSESIDGGSRQAQWRTTKDITTYEMDSIATDRVNYPLMDIQQGDISQSEAINAQLRYDLDMKIDAMALANLQAAQAASGLQALMSLHSLVDPNTVPDANYFDLNVTFPGADDILTIDKLKFILNHIALLSASGIDGGLSVQSILMSPLNLRDSWDFVDLVSGVGSATEGPLPTQTVTSETRQSIFETGMFTSAWGFSWNWVPNSQIPKGRMYILMNKPLGWLFTKKSMDKFYQWNDTNSIDHAESNMGEMLYRRVLAFVMPDLWKYRVLIIDL